MNDLCKRTKVLSLKNKVMSAEEKNWGQDQNQNQGQNQNTNQNQNPSGQNSTANSGTGQNTAPFQITGNWREQSSQLKDKYGQLTDSDLDFKPGQENQLMDQIGTRLNKSRDEVANILNEFNTSNPQNQNQNQDRNQFNEDEPDRFAL
jgi:uncharacterized protein YjbJ (UPF0337 family)